MSNLGHRSIAVVRHCLDQQRDATRTITFISDLFVMHALFFAGAATNRALDRIVRHVTGFGVSYRFAQTSVPIHVAAARAGCDSYLLDEFREQFAALGIERAFLMFDTMPLRMSGHRSRNPLRRIFLLG